MTTTQRQATECTRPKLQTHPPDDLSEFVPAEQWSVFRQAITAARATGAPFALGGGLAISFYTGMWRRTKDLDLYILPADREAMIRAVSGVGMIDYFTSAPYDRAWIYRGYRGGMIVDLIWALANGIADVDAAWLRCGATVEIEGESLPLIAPEEMFWSKVHVVQRDRCDWPDLVNLLFTAGPAFDWERLLLRLGSEETLLASVLMLFAWVAPGRAVELPGWLWPRLGLRPPAPGSPLCDRRRVDLLDTRPWFTPVASGLASGPRAVAADTAADERVAELRVAGSPLDRARDARHDAPGGSSGPRRAQALTERRPARGQRSAGTSKA
jgi:hypothetical protein